MMNIVGNELQTAALNFSNPYSFYEIVNGYRQFHEIYFSQKQPNKAQQAPRC